MTFYPLEKLINLYDGYRQVFVVDRKEVLLIQEEGRCYAIQAACPHLHWPLQNAPISGQEISCSKHGWSFDLHSGRGANERALGCQLKVYKIAYEGNTLGIYA